MPSSSSCASPRAQGRRKGGETSEGRRGRQTKGGGAEEEEEEEEEEEGGRSYERIDSLVYFYFSPALFSSLSLPPAALVEFAVTER